MNHQKVILNVINAKSKQKQKQFTDRTLLSELPFYQNFLEGPSITKFSTAFKNYVCWFTDEVLSFRYLGN